MLKPDEFTVGTFEDAKPSSLVLARNEHEDTAIVGEFNDAPTAVFLTGEYRFHLMPTAGTMNWAGVIVPKVAIEVDENSVFDPGYGKKPLGSVIRTGSQLAILARPERSGSKLVVLQKGLSSAGDMMAGFAKWRVVIGEGLQSRVLIEIDATPPKVE